MAQTKKVANAMTAPLFATCLLAALGVSFFGVPAPALAQTAFGQEMPQQYFVNRFTNPAPAGGSPSSGSQGAASAGGQAASGGGAAQAANDDDGPGPYPKRYLLNRLFDMGRPAADAAPAPAAK